MKGFKPSKVKIKPENKPLAMSQPRKKIITIAVISIVALLLIIVAVIPISYFAQMDQYGKSTNSIFISKTPTKSEYDINESINLDGIKVIGLRNNNTTYDIDISECEVIGFDSKAPTNSCTITVIYQGFRTSFTVKIKEPEEQPRIPESISILTYPNKMDYKIGDTLSVKGGVILVKYTDGSEQPVNLILSHIPNKPVLDTAKEYEITIKYKENGEPVYLTYTITVTE